eukprot:s386_g30.t1
MPPCPDAETVEGTTHHMAERTPRRRKPGKTPRRAHGAAQRCGACPARASGCARGAKKLHIRGKGHPSPPPRSTPNSTPKSAGESRPGKSETPRPAADGPREAREGRDDREPDKESYTHTEGEESEDEGPSRDPPVSVPAAPPPPPPKRPPAEKPPERESERERDKKRSRQEHSRKERRDGPEESKEARAYRKLQKQHQIARDAIAAANLAKEEYRKAFGEPPTSAPKRSGEAASSGIPRDESGREIPRERTPRASRRDSPTRRSRAKGSRRRENKDKKERPRSPDRPRTPRSPKRPPKAPPTGEWEEPYEREDKGKGKNKSSNGPKGKGYWTWSDEWGYTFVEGKAAKGKGKNKGKTKTKNKGKKGDRPRRPNSDERTRRAKGKGSKGKRDVDDWESEPPDPDDNHPGMAERERRDRRHGGDDDDEDDRDDDDDGGGSDPFIPYEWWEGEQAEEETITVDPTVEPSVIGSRRSSVGSARERPVVDLGQPQVEQAVVAPTQPARTHPSPLAHLGFEQCKLGQPKRSRSRSSLERRKAARATKIRAPAT